MQEIEYRHQLEHILKEYNVSYSFDEDNFKTEREKILFLHEIIQNSDIDFADLKNRKGEKKVLCIEPNIAHDSMLPSFFKYFKDLGYSVDFLLAEDFNLKRWDFFTNCTDKPKYFLKKNMPTINAFMSLKCLYEYDVVMLNTDVIWDMNNLYCDYCIRYLDYLKDNFNIIPHVRNNILQLYVHINQVPSYERHIMLKKHQFLNGSPIFSLIGYKGIPMFSPQYFGDINITEKNENICKFVTLGCNVKTQHNYEILISALNNLLKDNITNFIIITCIDFDFPEYLKQYITIKYVQPPELYKEIEDADFILPLYDSSVSFARNTFGKGTGSTLNFFSFGFLKPMIIENIFAKVFKIKGYIGYDSPDKLYLGMKKAIEINKEQYQKLQNSIKNEADFRYNKTLNDIKKVIANNEKNKYKVIVEKEHAKIPHIFSVLQKIFSVRNDGNHKLLRILGIKIKFKR